MLEVSVTVAKAGRLLKKMLNWRYNKQRLFKNRIEVGEVLAATKISGIAKLARTHS